MASIFDDFTKKAAKFTEEAMDITQEFAGTAKTKLKIKNLETDRDDIYMELGKYYFHLIRDENSLDEHIAELRSRIYDYEVEIEELKKNLDEQL